VTDPGGDTARYRYDEVGNRLGVDRFPSSQLSVLSVVPATARPGDQVVVSGTGFSATAADDTVKFGTVPAQVTAATVNRLTVTVPAGAGSAPVSVSVSGTSTQSPEAFSLAAPGPVVSGIAPASGMVGTSVVISGSGFAAAASDNVVRFNGVPAEVSARTDTSLTVFVPDSTTGKVTVTTPAGTTTSASDFTIPASGDAYDTTVKVAVSDTSPTVVAVTRPGLKGRVLFDASAGDDVSLGFTSKTFTSLAGLTLHSPQGSQIGTADLSGSSAPADWDLSDLPVGGTYTMVLAPSSNETGQVSVTLSAPVAQSLNLTGTTPAAQITRPGQDARWSVDETAGNSLGLGLDASGMTVSGTLSVYRPDGIRLDQQSVSAKAKASYAYPSLPATGRYTVVFDPSNAATGTVSLTGSPFLQVGTLSRTAAGSTVQITRFGQWAVATFHGDAGTPASLAVTGVTFTQSAYVRVLAPDGTQVTYLSAGSGSSVQQWDSASLPQTGTYTVRIEPYQGQTGSATLTLSDQLSAGALATTAATTQVSVSRPGQDVTGTFTATAGDNLSLAVTKPTLGNSSDLTVTAPSGATVVNKAYVSGGSTTALAMPNLPETGTYHLLINPSAGATGSFGLALSADARITPAVNGSSVALNLSRPGQRGRIVFTGHKGDLLGFGVSANSLATTANLTLVRPDGSQDTSAGSVSSSSTGCVYLAPLPADGTYQLLAVPQSADATGSQTWWLSSLVSTATLTPGGSNGTAALSRPGQQVRVPLTATAGSGAAVTFTGTSLTQAADLAFVAPDGTLTKGLGTVYSSTAGTADLFPPLAAGTYQVLARPQQPATGTLTAAPYKDADGGSLTPGGAQNIASVASAGQNARFVFAGTAGQTVSLTIGSAAYSWYVNVVNPDGTRLVNHQSVSKTAVTYPVPKLPATGTYLISVDPASRATGAITLGVGAPTSPAANPITTVPPVRTAAARTPADTGTPTSRPAPASAPDPAGPDVWTPGKENLAGHDWITRRGPAPAAPPALSAPPGVSALSGRVLKLDGKPLPHVTVTAGTQDTGSSGAARASATTDRLGRFLLRGLAPSTTTVIVDGSTANTRTRSYGLYRIRVHPVAGHTTLLGFPVWMSPLDTADVVHFPAPTDRDVVLTTPKIPGLEVHIPKGSVIRDAAGRVVTQLGITPIPIDRSPFPLPTNGIVPVFFTVQPGGSTVFPDGATIVYPNYTHAPPGSVMDFLSYDPKGAGWHTYGHGKVSPDGRQVVPDKGTKVWSFDGAMFNTGLLPPFDFSWLGDFTDWLSGDPVNLATGMMTSSQTDLAVSDVLSAELTRSYWQGDTHSRAFGIGQDLVYNAFLHSEQQYQQVDLYLPGGRKVHFTRSSPGTGWSDAVFTPATADTDFTGAVIRWNNNAGWNLSFADGTTWVFPEYAPLNQIRDRHGNTVLLTRDDGNYGNVTRITTPNGRWISLTYDTGNRVTLARDNAGRSTSYHYDSAGRLDSFTDAAGHTTKYVYDGTSSRLATVTDARGITYLTNTYVGARVSHQRLTGGTTYDFTYTTDASGNITATDITQPDGTVRHVAFDTAGYATSETQAAGTSLARTTTFTRDTGHKLASVTDPWQRRTDLHYDSAGRYTGSTELAGTPDARDTGTVTWGGPWDQPQSSADALGHTTTYHYDTDGNLSAVTDPEGRETDYTYQSDGQVKSVTDPAHAVTTLTYDHGDLSSVQDANGATDRQFSDAAGRPVAITDASGATTTYQYDALNNLKKLTDPLGHTTSYGYDENGNLKTLTDARNNTWAWDYNDSDEPYQVTDPLGAVASFGYDTSGRVTSTTTRAGRKATETFDALSRPRHVEYTETGQLIPSSTADYAYWDSTNDQIKAITDSLAGTTSYSYDVHDRLTATTGPTGTVAYTYDGADRLHTMTAAGRTQTYTWDRSSILTSLADGTDTTAFTLDPVGREKAATFPGGWARSYDTDTTGQIKAITYTHNGTAAGTLSYDRDVRGLQTGLSGTLARIAIPAAQSAGSYDAANRPSALDGQTRSYDADGNLTASGQTHYAWNDRQQLTGISGSGTSASFGYDAAGTRITRTVGGTTTKYLTNGSNPLAELDASGNPVTQETTGGLDDLLTRTENGTTQVYLTDAMGSVVGLGNPDGTVATSFAYDPSGATTASGAPSDNPFAFTGRENDGTGLAYYRDRYYDPSAGSFISEDPTGQAGGSNLYEYALDSPTTYTDPTGDNPLLAECAVGGLVDGGLDYFMQRLSGRKVNWGEVGTSALTGCLTSMLLPGDEGGFPETCSMNSFAAGTNVLMADGTRKPIEDVRVGEQVAATDPTKGDRESRPITALIQGTGDKQLTDITIGGHTITATDNHPFWVPDIGAWIDAGNLTPGQWLRTSNGTWVQVTAIRHHTDHTTVYNLTVDGPHTYYVLAGATPVLAHNSRAGNLCPHPDAEGPHTTFRRDGTTGSIDHYETYDRPSDPRDPRPWVPTKRVDVKGKPHFDKKTRTRVPTPHVNLPDGSARPAEPWEIPKR
jgi:RHS repeat-associated protein